MTEAETPTPTSWPELGTKSPEKPKPRTAPREKKADNRNKDRKEDNKKDAAPRDKNMPADNGEPLIKPAAVLEPNHEQQEKHDQKLRDEIDADEKRVTELNELIDKAREERGEHNESIKTVRNQLNEFRNKSRDVAAERDALVEQLKKHSELMKKIDMQAQRLRKELKMLDAAAIDKTIKNMAHQLETSSVDLKTEKLLVQEMRKLGEQKEQVKQYEQEKANLATKKAEHEEIYQKRMAIGEKLNKMRDEEKALGLKLDAMRAGEGTADGVAPSQKVTDLMNQKQQLIDGMKAKRAAIKESNVQFRVKMAEFREFQRAMQAYDNKVQRREYTQRKAEQAEKSAQYKEQKKQRDLDRKEDRARQEKRFAAVASGFQMYVGGLLIRATDEDLRKHFATYGEILDCVVVADLETKVSRGFGFVTMSTKEAAEQAIAACHGKEFKTICPPHVRMLVKFAEKSKQQQEWEAKQKKSAENKAAKASDSEGAEKEGKGDGKGEGKSEGKKGGKKGKAQQPAEGSEAANTSADGGADAEDDHPGDKSEDKASAEETDKDTSVDKGDDDVTAEDDKNEEIETDESKKDWKATRTDWIKDDDTNGQNGNINGEANAVEVDAAQD